MPPLKDEIINQDPASYAWFTYGWVLMVSVWGGVARYMKRVALGFSVKFSWHEFIADITTSGFVGMVTFFICESAKIDRMMEAAIIGISAHMGSRALFLFEQLLIAALKNRGRIE